MKNLLTCAFMLTGYVAAALLFFCGALLYLPIGIVVGCVEVARDRKARSKALQLDALQPGLSRK